MSELKLGSAEFFQACRELTLKTYNEKVPKEMLETILNFIPNPDQAADPACNSVPTPVAATVNITAAFIYGTVECTVGSLNKSFSGTHWGPGLAGFGSTGCIYTAYENWNTLFSSTTAYHAQSAGVVGGVVQVTWFNKSGVAVGQYNGVAGGVGALEVGGSGKWK